MVQVLNLEPEMESKSLRYQLWGSGHDACTERFRRRRRQQTAAAGVLSPKVINPEPPKLDQGLGFWAQGSWPKVRGLG